MTHVRIDDGPNSRMLMACGIGPSLPEGDQYVFESEFNLHHMVDCPRCKEVYPSGPLGTPLSELDGRPGMPGYERFLEIAKSWGYE